MIVAQDKRAHKRMAGFVWIMCAIENRFSCERCDDDGGFRDHDEHITALVRKHTTITAGALVPLD